MAAAQARSLALRLSAVAMNFTERLRLPSEPRLRRQQFLSELLVALLPDW